MPRPTPDTAPARQPNIVFILADDLGQRDLGCYGSTFYETPHLDRLARQGVTFTDAYAACPVSSPTRASLLTGRYPARVQVTDWIDPGWGVHPIRARLIDAPYVDHLPETETTLAHALGAAGYQTWHVGKWHLGDEKQGSLPTDRGFDVNVGGTAQGAPSTYFSPWNNPNLDDAEPGTYLDQHLTSKAVELIQGRDADRPFYLNMAFYLVHTPIEAPEPLVDKYRQKARQMRLDQIEPIIQGEANPAHPSRRVRRRVVQSDPTYAAMVEIMDHCVGRLLQALDEAGVADDTIVMFTSDNGGLSTAEGSPTCNFPLNEGKGWTHEGGVREPWIVRYPRLVPPGTTCSQTITSPDLFPTCLELAGLPAMPEQHADGLSFASLLRDPATARLDRDAIYWHYPHYGNQGGTPGAAIRQGDWKLIESFETGRVQLFNLGDDLSETRDRAADETDRSRRLTDLLHAWRREIGGRMPEPNPDYQPPDDPLAHPAV